MEELHRGDDAKKDSRLPLVWNVTYDDFLRMDLPAGTSVIDSADDALFLCALKTFESCS